jgi:hypothetical protein
MSILQVIEILWPVLLALTGLVVWAVRQESKIKSCHTMLHGQREYFKERISAVENDIHALTVRHESLDSKVVEQLAQVRESLARIEGALGVKEK